VSDEAKEIIGGVVALLLGVFILASLTTIGCEAGHKSERRLMREEAVKRGFAEYDSKTGNWQWKGEAAP
jgi:hypothetical protein